MTDPIIILDSPSPPPLRPISNNSVALSFPRGKDVDVVSLVESPDHGASRGNLTSGRQQPVKRRKVENETTSRSTDSGDPLDDPFTLFDNRVRVNNIAPKRSTVAKTHIKQTVIVDDDDDDDDDFVFKPRTKKAEKEVPKATTHTATIIGTHGVWVDDDETNDLQDPFLLSSQETLPMRTETGDLLARIRSRNKSATTSKKSTCSGKEVSPKRAKPSGSRNTSTHLSESEEEDNGSSHTPPNRRKAKLTEAEKAERARERESAREERERQKAAEKERKRLEKEAQARAKQLDKDIAAVNQQHLNREATTADMVLDVSSDLFDARLGDMLKQYMLRLEVPCHSFPSPIPNIVKWRRKCRREWNEAADRWSPRPEHIVNESHVLCHMTAKAFNELVSANPSSPESLDSHVRRFKAAHANSKPIYLIEGLHQLLASARNASNREHAALVLAQVQNSHSQAPPPPPPSSSSSQSSQSNNDPHSRKRKTASSSSSSSTIGRPVPIASEDTLDAALISLQLNHGLLIHHTSDANSSAEWITRFTQHISTIPSRQEAARINEAVNFSFEIIDSKDDDPARIWNLMLQQFSGVKAAAAEAVKYRYPNVGSLYRGFQTHGDGLIQDLKKASNRYGGTTDARLGPSISRRLHNVFTSDDPNSTDI